MIGKVTAGTNLDFLIGARSDGTSDHGRAYLVDGDTLTVATTFTSPNGESLGFFGGAVSGIGDVSGDGNPDVLVGASQEDADSTSGAGRAYILDSSDGSLISTLTSPTPTSDGSFGQQVVGVAGSDAGTTPKAVVGAPGESTGGAVYIFRGGDGTRLQSLASSNAESNGGFGRAVTGTRDVTGDGAPDVFVGAPFETVNGTGNVGRVYVIDGANGGLYRTYTPPSIDGQEEFGSALVAGDLLGNG